MTIRQRATLEAFCARRSNVMRELLHLDLPRSESTYRGPQRSGLEGRWVGVMSRPGVLGEVFEQVHFECGGNGRATWDTGGRREHVPVEETDGGYWLVRVYGSEPMELRLKQSGDEAIGAWRTADHGEVQGELYLAREPANLRMPRQRRMGWVVLAAPLLCAFGAWQGWLQEWPALMTALVIPLLYVFPRLIEMNRTKEVFSTWRTLLWPISDAGVLAPSLKTMRDLSAALEETAESSQVFHLREADDPTYQER